MAEGLNRKAVVEDRLSGAANIQPVVLPTPNPRANIPSAPAALPDTYAAGVANELGGYLSQTLQDAAQKQHERSMLEGQVAYHQGETFNSVEMEGDKWALEGYRTVQAQTMSSGLLQAQLREIEQGGQELGPDEFREQYMARIEGMMEGMGDERTREMAAYQINKQLPEVVAKHTSAHLAWQEQKNYDGLETAVDVISRDATSAGELISFVTDSPATAGLSPDRKKSAMVSGVIRAMNNGNYNAYGMLSSAGVLGDNLTSQQQNAIRAAKSNYESRVRAEYDEDFFKARQDLAAQVKDGLDPSHALEQLSTLMAEKNLTMNATEAGQIYSAAQDGVRTATITRANLIADAGLRNDYATQAGLINETLEQGGYPTVNGGDMKALLTQFNGDTDKALVAYAWNPSAAAEWDGKPASLPDDVREYVERVGKQVSGEAVFTPGQRLQASQNALTATRARVAMGKYEAMQPELADLDQKFKHNAITKDEWQQARARLFKDYEVERTKADVNAEIALGTSVQDAAIKQHKADVEQAKMEALAPELADIDIAFKSHGNKARWSRERKAAFAAVGLDRDAADLGTERRLTLAVDADRRRRIEKAQDKAVRDAEKVQDRARAKAEKLAEKRAAKREAEANEQRKFMYGVSIRESGENLQRVADLYAEGKATAQDVSAARKAHHENMSESAEAFDIPFKADQGLKDLDAVVKTVTEAVNSHKKFQEDSALIGAATASQTMDQLPAELQERALKNYRDFQARQLADAVADGSMDTATAEQQLKVRTAHYAASAGMVDPNQKRVVNGYLAHQSWAGRDGFANPLVADALEQAQAVYTSNPNMLPKLIPDAATREKAMLAFQRKDIAGSWDAAISTIEGTTPRGSRIDELNSEKMQSRIEALRVASADLDTWGFFRTESSFRTARQQARLTDPNGEPAIEMRAAIQAEAEQVMLRDTGSMSPEEATTIAAQNVKRRAAIIGGDFVDFPNGQSISEAMFGPQAKDVDIDGAPNQVVLDILMDPAMRAKHPILERTSSFRDWWEDDVDGNDSYGTTYGSTGELHDVRPFTVNPHPTADGKWGLAISVLRVAPERDGVLDWAFGDDRHPGWTEPIIVTPDELRTYGSNWMRAQSQ